MSENATYESLEEVHVLALAHVLRRTIIVMFSFIHIYLWVHLKSLNCTYANTAEQLKEMYVIHTWQ